MAAGAGEFASAAGTTSPGRERSFDEGWRFHRGEAAGAQAAGFDDSTWRRLDLPHDWSIEDLPGGSSDDAATRGPSVTDGDAAAATAPVRIGPFDAKESAGGKSTGFTVGGVGWYRKEFRVAGAGRGDRVELRFDGVYCNSDVWVNGKHLGSRPNGYVQFAYDLTPHLKLGKQNVVAVRVRNVGKTSRWYSGSGIYRHTWLTVTDRLHVPLHGVQITTPEVSASSAKVHTTVTLQNDRPHAASVRVRTTLVDDRGRRVATRTSGARRLKAGGTTNVSAVQKVSKPRRWSPASPHRYRAQVDVLVDGKVIDSLSENFGIRTVQMDGRGFRLNGVTTKMRGANIHHDHGALGAVSLDRSEERRVEVLKAAGFNAIRLAHNPHNPRLLDICDRLGMLVYDEFSDVWDTPKTPDDYSNYFAKWWKRDLASWVAVGQNHPSVVIRSIGNEINLGETPEQAPKHTARGKQLADEVRRLDPTRPVCQGGGQAISIIGTYPNNSAYVDVLDQHYVRDVSALVGPAPKKAILCSESHIESLDTYWALVEDNAFDIGDFTWTGWDYIGEAGVGHPAPAPVPPPGYDRDLAGLGAGFKQTYPWVNGACGDHDLLGRENPQMRYRRVVWGDSPLELMVERPGAEGLKAAAWSWYDELESWTWPVATGQQMTVRAYTTGDQVRLLLNGTQVSETAVGPDDRRIATFTVPYAPGRLEALAFRSGEQIGSKVLTTAGAPAKLRLRSDTSRLTTDRDALAHVFVDVLDNQGRLVPDAVVKVAFKVAGGTLAGLANGNPHNVDSFKQPRHWTWKGQALAIVRPPKKAGQITLSATADGVTGASLSIPVRAATSARGSAAKAALVPQRMGVGAGVIAGAAIAGFRALARRRDEHRGV